MFGESAGTMRTFAAEGRLIEFATQEEDSMAGKSKRTTHRSTAGKKLYAVRDAKGQFKDIQTYERAHGMDVKRKSKAEKRKKK